MWIETKDGCGLIIDDEGGMCCRVDHVIREVHRRGRRWQKLDELSADGRAHFEYAQRTPLEDVRLAVK